MSNESIYTICYQNRGEHGYTLYICAGAIYGRNTVHIKGLTIPTHYYKTVIVTERNVPVDTVCVVMPNDDLDIDWKRYVVPLDEVEMRSGYVLFRREQ